MSALARAVVCLKLVSEKQLKVILDAIGPEANVSQTRRANVALRKDGSVLVLTVEARDTVALRATLNAYLRWINSTIEVMNTIEQA